MVTNQSNAFRALLSDLSAQEPRYGFQTADDVTLTSAQVGAFCQFSDSLCDVLADTLPAIAAQMLTLDSNPTAARAAIADLVIEALKAGAREAAVSELAMFCDEQRQEEADDRAYEASYAA